jgi:hypothetical protein
VHCNQRIKNEGDDNNVVVAFSGALQPKNKKKGID